MSQERITTREALITTLPNLRKGKKIVFTSGSFDLIHPGHVAYLEAAKKLGDILIVGLNSDSSVKSYKDPLRPINPSEARAAVLAGLRSVDFVFVFDEDNNNKNIELLKPDLYVKAGDYDKSKLSSAPLVEKYGGKVEIIKFEHGYSSTKIIDTIANRYDSKTAPGSELGAAKPAPAVFFDRDGTLIEHVEYLSEPAKVKLLPHAGPALKKLQDKGFRLIIVTNQPGIGLGYFTREDFYAVNRAMLKQLSKEGVLVDKIYFCPHSMSEKCSCRKPGTEMAMRAKRELNIELEKSFMVGDMTGDLEFGKKIGAKSILVKSGQGGADKIFKVDPDFTASDLNQAAEYILK